MTNPIKNNQTPPASNDPYSKSYGNDPYGGDYGQGYDPNMGNSEVPPDSYSGYEDMNYGDYGDFSDMNSDFEVEGGDEGYGDDAGTGAGAPVTEASVRAMLRDLQGTLSEDDYRAFQGRINATTGMSPDRAAAELQAIAEELNMIANPEENMLGEDGEPVVNSEEHAKAVDDFKKELEDYRDAIMDNPNLSEDEKAVHAGEIDKMINEVELAEKDPEALAQFDLESAKETLKEYQAIVDEAAQFPVAAKSLAEACEMEPAALAAKAEAAGVSLENLSPPPSAELLDFLKEVIPGLQEKIDAVASAISERQTQIDTKKKEGEAIQSGNKGGDDSNTSDVQGAAVQQELYDLMYHQDELSKKVTDAKKAVMDALLPVLKGLYPEEDVKAVESSAGQGYNDVEKQYNVADQISIGGTTYDLFNNTTGAFQANSSVDTDATFEVPPVTYDGEGDGAWNGPAAAKGVNTYGGPACPTDQYDDSNGDDY